MKSALVIIAIVGGCFLAAFGGLRALGVKVNSNVPLATCSVALISGLAGILPLEISRDTHPPTMLQKALAGTILHMLVAAALSLGVIWMLRDAHRTNLIFWVLGGYWLSLLAVVWRTRQLIVKASAMITPASSVSKAF